MANGGIRRFAAAAGAMLAAGLSAVTSVSGRGVHVVPRQYEPEERTDIQLGRWSYARKGKRTAAQVKRAARKKRNRARHK